MNVTRAQAARITGCSAAQLAAWARSGLVVASAEDSYDFTDLVSLRVVRSMLDAGLSLGKIKRAVAYLRESGDDLVTLRIVTDGDGVWACHDDGQILDALRHGQLALFVAVDRYVDDVASGVAKFVAERDAFIDGLRTGDDAASAS